MTIIIHDTGQERKRNVYVQHGSHTLPMDDGARTGKHAERHLTRGTFFYPSLTGQFAAPAFDGAP